MNIHPLKTLVDFNKKTKTVGIYSACTANEFVIEACMEKALNDGSLVLIEATANQVNQYGGYTNMKPMDFRNFVMEIANRVNLPYNQIILGGDHLGPLTFKSYSEDKAMREASELIRQFVMASFTKIHIDTSVKLLDDDTSKCLSNEVIARRATTLVKVAEEAYSELIITKPTALHPVYVIGSEVPTPGGATDNASLIQITEASDFIETVKVFEEIFIEEGLQCAWSNVIAVVVQVGIEENNDGCIEYDRSKTKDLMKVIHRYPNLVFEGHSTDYQTKIKLKELVNDGVAILKVGPALTFAAREAIFALARIEEELYRDSSVEVSNFIKVLDDEILKNPKYWNTHYHGNDNEITYKRKYSFSDRSRYYMPLDSVQKALDTLLENLINGVPLSLLSQYMPLQYTKVREGSLKNNPKELIKDRIKYAIEEYLFATEQNKILF